MPGNQVPLVPLRSSSVVAEPQFLVAVLAGRAGLEGEQLVLETWHPCSSTWGVCMCVILD